MSETIYNLINNTQRVIVHLGPGTYNSSVYIDGLRFLNHMGLKKGDTICVSARFSLQNVKNLSRCGFEPFFNNEYYGCWANQDKNNFTGIISKKYTIKKDVEDGTSIGQGGIYVQGNMSNQGFMIEDGGWIKIDHVMMNKGSEPAAWAPSAEEEISVGGGWNND